MDNKTQDILAILKHNARTPISDISIAVQLSESEVSERLSQLESSGAILGYQAIVSDQAQDAPPIRALVELSVELSENQGYNEIAQSIYQYPQVVGHYLLSGSYDYLVIVEGKSHHDIARFVFEKLATIDQVKRTNTHFVFRKYKEAGFLFKHGEDEDRLAVSP